MRWRSARWCLTYLLMPVLAWLAIQGCQAISNRLTRWNMLGQEALDDPIRAVGGDGIVFAPREDGSVWTRQRLATATTQELVAYYAPVFIQQRVNSAASRYPYPPEYDQIGTAQLRREESGKIKAFVAGEPRVYALAEKRTLGGHERIQLTWTAWYPAHPRMKAIDLEEADIDSCVVRVTLDADHAPVLYETIAACGCFHKVFVLRWVEEGATRAFGPPESGKKYSVERSVKDAIDWEVAGVIDEPRDKPSRPVVFIQAGDHKVLGMGSSSRLRVPAGADRRGYELVEYADLYSLPVAGEQKQAPFFDLEQGGKVWGAQRKERFLLTLVGVDGAGQPRANDQIKLHFDQSTWSDETIYQRFLRLPPEAL
ncbi:MAG: hypothetical protein JO244_14810 [Solirubrobacterales bacterium]|nr:hypothetical protein [Solirubrobacterales bacterium]